jgi:transposase InsO family protein
MVKAGHRITGNPRDETRGAGWEFLHVAVDDHSSIVSTALYHDEIANSSTYIQRFGVATRRVLTDNGPCFYAHRFAQVCRDLDIIPKRTRIYTPRTNGNAEDFFVLNSIT